MAKKPAATTAEDNVIIQFPGTRLGQRGSGEDDLEQRVTAIEDWIVDVWRDPRALLERVQSLIGPSSSN